MRMFVRAALAALVFCGSMNSQAQQAMPQSLRDWEGWVLRGEEFRRCPFLASANLQPGQPIDAGAFRCSWPERLSLNVDARGGSFTQRWQVYADSWVALPGDTEHWPRDVRVNGQPASVVAIDGVPNLRLAPGSYAVSGRFEWTARPEALPLPDTDGHHRSFVDGQRVAQPERPDGAVWLGKRRTAEQPAAMEVQVYRLVRDEIPAYLSRASASTWPATRARSCSARALPDGFTPLSLGGAIARAARTRRHAARAGASPAVTR